MNRSRQHYRWLLVAAFALLATVLSLITGCSGKKPDASPAVLEDARGTARENALWNAQRFRQENVLYQGWDIVARGDSSQMPECPQGDGWATMDFIRQDKSVIVKVKCSTYSANLGCLEDKDFKTKSYASEDGNCQPTTKVPFPLPKVAK